MRRSSAPSQLNKANSIGFQPPYKRPCLTDVSSNKINLLHGTNHPQPKTFLNDKQNHATNLITDAHKDQAKVLQKKEPSSKFLGHCINNPEENINVNDSNCKDNPICQKTILENDCDGNEISSSIRYFSVVWCKFSKKKHKKWEGDAVLIVKSRSVSLKDMEGKTIGSGSGYKLCDLISLEEGNTLPVGAKEIEIQGTITRDNFISGKCFQSCISVADEPIIAVIAKPKFKPFCLPTRGDSNIVRNPSMRTLYDASHPDAIVMPRPPCGHQFRHNPRNLPVTDVIIDPHLGSKLRPHQKDGIIFLYECVMGFRIQDHQGAILADEMGLGKTLQCISLIWTLFKQGPYGCQPVFRKILIVTPSSICANWGKEFDKWLGKERFCPFIVDQQNKVEDFLKQRLSPVLIISYEMAVRNIDLINRESFDLLLCDEGHRLKNISIKTTSLLSKVAIKLRIIATGTPIQNDLQELFALVEFVNPGMLGSSLMFRRVYEDPIIRSQQPGASMEEKQIGERRAVELNKISSRFTLRRTQEIINKYLPPKTEYVIFCRPAETQSDLYEAISGCRSLQRCLTDNDVGDHLSAICILRKLCNHPALLAAYEQREHLSVIQQEVMGLMSKHLPNNDYLEEHSGKLAVVSCLLWSLSEAKKERIVIVSNFTTTLDMLQQMCERYSYSFLRLDGTTPIAKRQPLVDRFNSPSSKDFVFLLSAKAGGVGLNLIGASRIILFDIDWNPATDLQAMARVWRDGQKKEVFIYRLLLAGSIEEKMYQRQVCKQGISGSVVDARQNTKVKFSVEELKDLFKFYPAANCLTHDSLNCCCDQRGGGSVDINAGCEQVTDSPEDQRECQLTTKTSNDLTTMDQLHSWQHYVLPEATDLLRDLPLESGADFINFVFKSHSS